MTVATHSQRQFSFGICSDGKEALLLAYADGETDARLELPIRIAEGETQVEAVAKARSSFIRQLLEADLESCDIFSCSAL